MISQPSTCRGTADGSSSRADGNAASGPGSASARLGASAPARNGAGAVGKQLAAIVDDPYPAWRPMLPAERRIEEVEQDVGADHAREACLPT